MVLDLCVLMCMVLIANYLHVANELNFLVVWYIKHFLMMSKVMKYEYFYIYVVYYCLLYLINYFSAHPSHL